MIYRPPIRSDELYHWGKKKSHKYIAKVGEGDDVRYFYTEQAYNNYKNGEKMTLVTDPKEIKEHEAEAQRRFELAQEEAKKKIIDEKRKANEEAKKKQFIDDLVQDKGPGDLSNPDKDFRDNMDNSLWPVNRKKTVSEKIKDFFKDSAREYGAERRRHQKENKEVAKEMGKEIAWQAKEAGKKWVENEKNSDSLLWQASEFLTDMANGNLPKNKSSQPKKKSAPSKKQKARKPSTGRKQVD